MNSFLGHPVFFDKNDLHCNFTMIHYFYARNFFFSLSFRRHGAVRTLQRRWAPRRAARPTLRTPILRNRILGHMRSHWCLRLLRKPTTRTSKEKQRIVLTLLALNLKIFIYLYHNSNTYLLVLRRWEINIPMNFSPEIFATLFEKYIWKHLGRRVDILSKLVSYIIS